MFSHTSAVFVISMSVLLCSGARGAITAFWQQVTITPAAITNDPALANMQSWDLMVTTTGDWGDAFMWADLPAPYVYYKHADGGLTRPNPSLFGMFPALEFTTYVSSPSDDGLNQTTLIGGGHPQSFPANLGDSTSLFPGIFSLAWANTIVDPAGTYLIARLTFPVGVLPNVMQGGDPSRTHQVSPFETAVIPNIPEPTAQWLLACIALALGSRGQSSKRLDRVVQGNGGQRASSTKIVIKGEGHSSYGPGACNHAPG